MGCLYHLSHSLPVRLGDCEGGLESVFYPDGVGACKETKASGYIRAAACVTSQQLWLDGDNLCKLYPGQMQAWRCELASKCCPWPTVKVHFPQAYGSWEVDHVHWKATHPKLNGQHILDVTDLKINGSGGELHVIKTLCAKFSRN